LVSSHSFPHLWKKLWKLGQNSRVAGVVAVFAGIPAGRKPGSAEKSAFLTTSRAGTREKQPPLDGEASVKADLSD
jgi:hypothetical protein